MIFETCEQEGPEPSLFTVQILQKIRPQKMADEEALNQILGIGVSGATMTRVGV
jgi:hypothetical protein